MLGVLFHFLCLPPKGFSIDKALAFAGSAVDEKPLMGRLVMGTEGTWRVGVAVLMKGWESPSKPTDRNRPTRRGSWNWVTPSISPNQTVFKYKQSSKETVCSAEL